MLLSLYVYFFVREDVALSKVTCIAERSALEIVRIINNIFLSVHGIFNIYFGFNFL